MTLQVVSQSRCFDGTQFTYQREIVRNRNYDAICGIRTTGHASKPLPNRVVYTPNLRENRL